MPHRSRAATVLLALAVGAAGCGLHGVYVDPRLVPAPATERVLHRLVLIGDAGAPKMPEPVLTLGRLWAERQRGRASVVFLGDNAYPRGLVASRLADAEPRLVQQIDAFAGSGAAVTFVPGNHDWDQSDEEGLRAVVAQSAFVRARGAGFIPSAGCPGPETLTLPAPESPLLRVVALDTQWWLHRHERGTNCREDSPSAVVAALSAALDTPLPVVVVGHHPLATNGPHGGFYDWRKHVFPLAELGAWGKHIPLPILGSLYPAIRSLGPSRQDIHSRANRDMRLILERTLAAATRPALKIYAGGHEHSLQVLTSTAVDFALVSGSGSSAHQTSLTRRYNTLFAHSQAGFMVLDLVDAGMRLSIIDATAPPDAPSPQFLLTRRR